MMEPADLSHTFTIQTFFDWLNYYALQWEPAWSILGALGSAGAAIAAVAIASRERADRVRADEERDRAREAQAWAEQTEARRAREWQARRVVIVCGRADPPESIVVRVENYSDGPVTDVRYEINGEEYSNRPILGPGEKVMFVATLPTNIEAKYAAVARFTDIAGVRWLRNAEGSLDEPTE